MKSTTDNLPDSVSDLKPKTIEKRRKYLNIYFDYVNNHATLTDLSLKYHEDITKVSRIVKWAVKYNETGLSNNNYRTVMIERVSKMLQKLDNLLDSTKDTRSKVYLFREKRLNEMFLAKLMDINNGIEEDDKKMQINVQINQMDDKGIVKNNKKIDVSKVEVVKE